MCRINEIGKLEKIKRNFLAQRTIFWGLICIFSYEDIEQRPGTQKNLNIGGTGLTRINFGNTNNTQKFIDTLKYYQQSLSQLTKTATEEEKEAFKKLPV